MTITENEVSAMVESLNVTHQGMTLTKDNATIAGLAYLIDMGLKQSLGDLNSTSRPAIVGVNSKGKVPDIVWSDVKRFREASRLGFVGWANTPEGKESLATAWIADAIATKFAKILSGELTVSEAGVRGDEVTREMRDLVELAVAAKAKKANAVVPKGKDMKASIDAALANDAIAAKFRALAEDEIARRNGVAFDDL